MPRRAKGAHLRLKTVKGNQYWIIRDGPVDRGTGCGAQDTKGAEKALAEYLAKKHRPDFGGGDPDQAKIADILITYAEATTDPGVVAPLPMLQQFWAGKTLAAITPKSCEAYVKWRCAHHNRNAKDKARAKLVKPSTARRDLEVLRAAIGHAHAERLIRFRVPVAVPDKPPARSRYLTRSEAARLLWAAWRRPMGRHVARFILLGLYTGSRHRAILKLQWMPNTTGGWVDLERRLIYRKGERQSETDKRRPPVGISQRLSSHLRRWQRTAGRHVIEFQGQSTGNLRNGFRRAVLEAGLDGVTPHTLRHTFASWAVQAGVPASVVGEAIGATEAVVRQVYGHLDPEFTRAAVEAVSGKGRETGKLSGKR